MQKVKFSICIPAYKSKYFDECLDSIFAQSVNDFELIILNDCSPEPIEEIVMKRKDIRIRYLKNENNIGSLNLTNNWNKCLEIATGQFTIIMGDDDRLAPNYLEEFSDLIKSYPDLNVYHCRSKIIDEVGNAITLSPSLPKFENVYSSIWHRLNGLRSNYISDYVYRTSSLIKQGGFFKLPLAWGSDDITAFIASADKGIAHSNSPVFEYRSNDLSISSTGNDFQKMVAVLEYDNWLNNFLQNHPPHSDDKIIYKNLLKFRDTFTREKKRYIMIYSMRKNPMGNFMMWFKHKETFKLTKRDIAFSTTKALKNRIGIFLDS
jgi:glycosyltransferase involved in cell wall biosynthesis